MMVEKGKGWGLKRGGAIVLLGKMRLGGNCGPL